MLYTLTLRQGTSVKHVMDPGASCAHAPRPSWAGGEGDHIFNVQHSPQGPTWVTTPGPVRRSPARRRSTPRQGPHEALTLRSVPGGSQSGQGGRLMNVQLPHQVDAMRLDGFDAQPQAHRDLLGRQPLRNALDDSPSREVSGSRGRGIPRTEACTTAVVTHGLREIVLWRAV